MITRRKPAITLMVLNHPPLSINHPRHFRIRLRDFLTSGDILDNSIAPSTIPASRLFHNHEVPRIRNKVLRLAHNRAAFQFTVS